MIVTLLMYALVLVSLILAVLIIYARWNYGQLEKLKIPFLPPSFMFGSIPDFYKKYPMLEDINLFKKFGSVFGLYEGRLPKIFVADPELVKLILVKDYDHFSSRGRINLGHPVSNEVLDYLPDDRWKAVRSMLTPNLTAGRVKNAHESTAKIADTFALDLAAECGEKDRIGLNLCSRMIAVLVDITATGMFGMELENRRDCNNTFVRLMTRILCEHVQYDFRYTLMLQFPFLSYLFPSWPFPIEALDKFQGIMLKYYGTRRHQLQRRNDLGQVFIDMMDNVQSPEYKKLGISQSTAIAQVLEAFFGAYDSTGTAMTMAVYNIAQRAEIQDRVLAEVDSVWDKFGECQPDGTYVLPHEALNELPYLLACINESLRLYPPFIRPERLCTQDWSAYSKDSGLQVNVKKGQHVYIPIWALHRHPDYYQNPEEYYPDRFMPKNKDKIHPYAFLPFGSGPKNCIGMKLAYTNMLVVLSRLFKDFRINVTDETKLDYKKGTRFVIQYSPIFLQVVKR